MDREIIDDPAEYGRRGHTWSAEFVTYMKAIVTHPAYGGMPDDLNEEGKIQWESPSNRVSGQYQYTYQKRMDWWREKATSIGIDNTQDEWISKTAKLIHPTGEKPCKRCGKVMRIGYVYPNMWLVRRIKIAFGSDFDVSEMEPVSDLIQRVNDIFGLEGLNKLSLQLSTKNIRIPFFNSDVEAFLEWIEDVYCPQEPSFLSPGAMSNAPDRFDGFHSFNRCCRGDADSGRHADNLISYTTDRRVFEYWSEGDWIAADRLMGLVKSTFAKEPCADGGAGPPTSDHIGPLSLGFCHRPEFRLLSRTANSSKNNRMSLSDVDHLKECEERGLCVASWYARPLWDLRKGAVDDEEKALRLSKQLRDNQRNAMMILCTLYDAKKFSFLVYLLELDYADRKVVFENLSVRNFLTHYDRLTAENRVNKYAIEQKARRLRIGFESLRAYKERDNRHSLPFAAKAVDHYVREAIGYLEGLGGDIGALDARIDAVLYPTEGIVSEESLRELATRFPSGRIGEMEQVKEILMNAMREVGQSISNRWEDDRYVRAPFEL